MKGQTSFVESITVDGFCGGGGWSTGFEFAIGKPVDIAINHDAEAIAMHKANHPYTKHYNENIYEVNPYEACGGRHVKWAHFSPDCTHFSVAKGGKPVKKNIRGLAWVVTKWAGTVEPDIISMENVPEFMTWGPLVAKRDENGMVLKKVFSEEDSEEFEIVSALPGERVPIELQLLMPDPKRKGETFRKFIKVMKGFGYEVEWKVLIASDYGAPTIRKRLFIIFRRDGRPIVWPEPTHGDPNSKEVKSGKLKPWRTAAECIDWSIPGKSIFDRKKPLAENTMKRIARGIKKFVIENPEPFIVQVNHGGDAFRGQSIDEPMPTLTAKHGFGLVTPTIMCNNDTNVGSSLEAPLHTVTCSRRHFLVSPYLIQYHSETGKTDVRGQEVDKPVMTIDTNPRYGLAAATMVQTGYGEKKGQKPRVPGIDKPLGTVVSTGKHAVVTAFISKYYAGTYNGAGSDIEEPLHTVTSMERHALISAFISRQFNTSVGHKADEPLGTVTQVDKSRLVEAFLVKYYGQGSEQSVDKPLDTITGKDRFGLVTIHGVQYQIVDICMRMLEPRELYRAQGFPEDYIIDVDDKGNPYPRCQQVAKCGNSVPPQFATALVRANAPEMCTKHYQTMQQLNEDIAI